MEERNYLRAAGIKRTKSLDSTLSMSLYRFLAEWWDDMYLLAYQADDAARVWWLARSITSSDEHLAVSKRNQAMDVAA